MSRRKKNNRVTPFAKLILFLLISTPILYFGISYATGQNGMENIKSVLGLHKKTDNESKSYVPENNISAEERDKIYQQIEEMKQQLREKNQTIKQLEQKISLLEGASTQ